MIIGIDPGKHGGIVALSEDGKGVQTYCIPKIKDEIDVWGIQEIFFTLFNSDKEIVVIEQVHAIYGSSAAATFSFGFICGLLEGIVVGNNFRYIKVKPKDWQKIMFEGIEPIYKPSKKKGRGTLETKKMAEIAYKKLFPQVDLYRTDNGNKSKKVHDGLVDALLIAEYRRRMLK